MKITFERSGGFANIHMKTEIDTATLAPDIAKELAGLLEVARPFEQPANQMNTRRGPADEFQYVITFNDGTHTHSIQTSGPLASSGLQELISWLQRMAFTSLKNRSR